MESVRQSVISMKITYIIKSVSLIRYLSVSTFSKSLLHHLLADRSGPTSRPSRSLHRMCKWVHRLLNLVPAAPIVASPSKSIAHVAAVDLIELLLLMKSLGTASVTYRLLTVANHDYTRYRLLRRLIGQNSARRASKFFSRDQACQCRNCSIC